MKKPIILFLLIFLVCNVQAQDINMKEFPRQYNEIRSLEFSNDSKHLLCASYMTRDAGTYEINDGATTVYNAETGVIEFNRKAEPAICAVFNPNNKEVLSNTLKNDMRKFNFQGDTTSKNVSFLRNNAIPFRVIYSSDGKYNIVGTAAGKIFVTDVASGKTTYTLTASEKPRFVISLHTINGGKTLVALCGGQIKYWDLSNGTLIRTVTSGTEKEIACMNVSADGKTMIGFAGEIIIWEAEKGELKKKAATGNGYCCAVSPDGKLMMFGFSKGFYVFDANGEVLRGWGGSADVRAMAFSPDGKSFVVGLAEGEVFKFSSAELAVPQK